MDDVEDLHRVWSEPAVRKYLWDDELVPRERVESIIKTSLDLFAENYYGLWEILPRNDHTLIGFCGFWSFHEPAQLELLYGISTSFWNKGFATEAASAMMDYGFQELSFPSIQASSDAPNKASVRVMEKLGMSFSKREATNGRDTLYYFKLSNGEGRH